MHHVTESVTMWTDRRLAMRPSPIHGIGVFATDPIHAGERLFWITGGIVYSTDDWRSGRVRLNGDMYNETRIADDLFVATPKGPYYYVNHSCDPSELNGVAWRDIAAGEEITSDYAYCETSLDYVLSPCRCGSPRCRGQMTGNDWRILALQQRYHGFFTPYVAGLIAAQ